MLFDSNRSSYLGSRTVEKDDFSHRPFSLLPLTEKVIRYLFASAEEVPHVLRSFFHLRSASGREVRTKGHLFTTRANALRRAIKTSTLRDMRIDTRCFYVSLDCHAQCSCESQICHLSVADGLRHGSSIQPHRQWLLPGVLLQKELNSQLAFGENFAFRL